MTASSQRDSVRGPVVIEEDGTFEFYRAADDAELDLEAIDVKNDEYRAFGGDGRSLRIEVVPVQTMGILGLFRTTVEGVRIHEGSTGPSLRTEALQAYFTRIGESVDESWTLEQLIRLGVDKFSVDVR